MFARGRSAFDGLHVVSSAPDAYDEVWCSNHMGNIMRASRVFVMDDLQYMASFGGDRAAEFRWVHGLKSLKCPLITSKAYPEWPTSEEFPLEDVVKVCGFQYFNTTGAYMVGYAIATAVKHMDLYGFDYTYPERSKAEEGRACCEFWIATAMARGIAVNLPPTTTLLDTSIGRPPYGYTENGLIAPECD